METKDYSEIIQMLESEGYNNIRFIEGKGLCGVRDFVFTVGLCYGLCDYGYIGRYCYPKFLRGEAVNALIIWDGKSDPIGNWIKHKALGNEYSNSNSK